MNINFHFLLALLMGIFHDTKNNKYYSGAGVIVITSNNNSIVVVRNKSNKKLSDFGGTFESKKHNNNLANTAIHELREESRNLIVIRNNTHLSHYFDIPISTEKKLYYRVYIIKINHLPHNLFRFNKQIIDNNNAKKYWRETDKLVDVHIENITNNNFNHRLSIAIKFGIKLIEHVANNCDELSTKIIINKFNKSKSFLNNTISFIIN